MIARIRRKKDADSIWVILRSPETGKWYLILEEIMRTTKIQIRDILGIREFNMNGESIELSGSNGVGKSSVLDAIRYALTNKSGRDVIVRRGAVEGEILIETDSGLSIDRKSRINRADYKSIKQNGSEIGSPEAFLKEIFTPLQLNPIEFMAMDKKQQNAIILDMIQYDWDMSTIKQWFGEIPAWVNYDQNILAVLNDIQSENGEYYQNRSLSAYIAKTDTGALKSCIEAIADDINLTAGGSINISGNKSVNIRGNTFSLDSSGTKISNTGYLQTVNAKLGEWNVDSKAIYCETADKVYTAYLQNPDYVVGNTRENAWVYSVQKNGIATFYVTSEGDLYCRCFSTPYITYQPNYRWATYENSLNTTLFIRTFHGPCLIIANVSIWTDDTSDYGTIKCGLYLDGYCVTENQHRLETTNAIELSSGATYVWYFSDNEAHTLSGIGGSTKNGKKTITYSVQALFNNDVGWGTGQ